MAPCTPFVSAVFNLEQVEGVTRPADDLPPRPEDRLQVAEQMFDVMLVAEIGAAFLCGFAGIENHHTEALQASYIEGWARVFQQDSRVLVRAASGAQRAADYIRGKLPAAEAKPLAAPEFASVQA